MTNINIFVLISLLLSYARTLDGLTCYNNQDIQVIQLFNTINIIQMNLPGHGNVEQHDDKGVGLCSSGWCTKIGVDQGGRMVVQGMLSNSFVQHA
jgi:hypothetical protein